MNAATASDELTIRTGINGNLNNRLMSLPENRDKIFLIKMLTHIDKNDVFVSFNHVAMYGIEHF